MKLTQEQKAIFNFVNNGEGHGIVNAVAGSGKTSTLLHIAAQLPQSMRVLFCAFNKSIGEEIAQRLGQQDVHHIDVKTIHALGYSLLQLHQIKATRINAAKYPQILDQLITNELQWAIDEVQRSENGTNKKSIKQFKSEVLQINSRSRSALLGDSLAGFKHMLERYDLLGSSASVEQYAATYFEVNNLLESRGIREALEKGNIDFKDMTFLPNQLGIASHQKYDFIFIDECQDLSTAQIETVLRFLADDGRVLAVGDTHQSIYAFMGADPNAFEKVRDQLESMSGVQQFSLSTCFRCPNEVIELARLYKNSISPFDQKKGEVTYIQADQINQFARPNDLIIARKKESLQTLAPKLLHRKLRVQFNGDSRQDSAKKPKAGRTNAVKLSTIHGAKGLEADRVFILDYDLLPTDRESMQEWERQQEENLVYVALTRAKNTLFLVHSS